MNVWLWCFIKSSTLIVGIAFLVTTDNWLWIFGALILFLRDVAIEWISAFPDENENGIKGVTHV